MGAAAGFLAVWSEPRLGRGSLGVPAGIATAWLLSWLFTSELRQFAQVLAAGFLVLVAVLGLLDRLAPSGSPWEVGAVVTMACLAGRPWEWGAAGSLAAAFVWILLPARWTGWRPLSLALLGAAALELLAAPVL